MYQHTTYLTPKTNRSRSRRRWRADQHARFLIADALALLACVAAATVVVYLLYLLAGIAIVGPPA